MKGRESRVGRRKGGMEWEGRGCEDRGGEDRGGEGKNDLSHIPGYANDAATVSFSPTVCVNMTCKTM